MGQATSASGARILDTIVNAARAAAEVIATGAASRATLEWESKGAADFVSEVDREAERRVSAMLAAECPLGTIIGEEFSPGEVRLEGLVFIVDPLDGTTNFLHGYPEYAVSIGAVQDGELVAGVILNAANGDLYTAAAGSGAWLNGERIGVSRIVLPALSLVGTGFPFKDIEVLPRYLRQFEAVTRGSSGIRRAGAASLDLAAVACGQFDAFWEMGLAPWDVAAGILLIREAGGVITDLERSPANPLSGSFVAGNPAIHAWLVDTLRSAT